MLVAHVGYHVNPPLRFYPPAGRPNGGVDQGEGLELDVAQLESPQLDAVQLEGSPIEPLIFDADDFDDILIDGVPLRGERIAERGREELAARDKPFVSDGQVAGDGSPADDGILARDGAAAGDGTASGDQRQEAADKTSADGGYNPHPMDIHLSELAPAELTEPQSTEEPLGASDEVDLDDRSLLSAPEDARKPLTGVSFPASSLTYAFVSEYDRLLGERHSWWVVSRITAVLVILGSLVFLLRAMTQTFSIVLGLPIQTLPLLIALICIAAVSNFSARMAWPTRRRVAASLRSGLEVLALAVPVSILLSPILLTLDMASETAVLASLVTFITTGGCCLAFLPRVYQQGPPELRFPE